MSSHNEEIARLTGSLFFKVDPSGLQRFLGMLKTAEASMARVGKQAEALSAKMGAKIGLKVDASAREKLDKQVRSSLDRELRGEILVQKARRATLTAELQGQKLQFAGQKQLAFLSSAAIRDKQAMAVLAAKEQAAQAAKLKTQGLIIKNESALSQAKARQTRAEAILQTQQQRTLALQAQQQRTISATARIEQAMMQARERGQRQAQKFVESQAAAKVRAGRQDVAHQQRQERFQWAQTRQAQWVANQSKPTPSTGFLGVGTGPLAVGGAAAGIAAIVGAISALGARMTAVQDRVSDSQSWANTIEQAGGKNPANRDFAKSEFLRITDKYGTSAGLDEAKEYRTFLLHQMAVGKSISQSTKMYETQMAAFRGAGMSKTEMARANIQLTQVRAKGKGDTEDVNTFSEAAPLLVDPIKQAWAERNKHKLDADLEKDFRASFKVGNLKAVDFERGLEIFNRDNKPAIEKQSSSIDSNATRLANQQYLQQQGIDQNAQLVDSINQRLKSEMDLNEAMKPLKETAAQLDIALNKLATSALRMSMGKSATGEVMTPEDRARQIGNAGVDGVLTLPGGSSDTRTTQQKLDADTRDPISKLWALLGVGRNLQSVADENRERWGQVGFDEQHAPLDPRLPALDTSGLNMKSLPNYGKHLEDLMVSPFGKAMASAVTNDRSAPGSKGFMTADDAVSRAAPVVNNNTVVNNTTSTPTTVTNNVTVHVTTDADGEEIAKAVTERIFGGYLPKEVE